MVAIGRHVVALGWLWVQQSVWAGVFCVHACETRPNVCECRRGAWGCVCTKRSLGVYMDAIRVRIAEEKLEVLAQQ